jgi:hypothetical protein
MRSDEKITSSYTFIFFPKTAKNTCTGGKKVYIQYTEQVFVARFFVLILYALKADFCK